MNFKRNSTPEMVGNYKWPKNTNFILYYDRVQRSDSYWKDPNTFDPDRFMEKDNENQHQLHMFGGGLRICK